MTRGEQREKIIIISRVEATDDEVSNTSLSDSTLRKVSAKVETISGDRTLMLGLPTLATNIRVSTFSKVTATDDIMWRNMRFTIGTITPKFDRFGTWYELICSSQNGS